MSKLLIVGLGNPGEEFEGTPHNIGFEVVDTFKKKIEASRYRKECYSLISQREIGTLSIIIAKPQTYMNRSGIAVKKLIEKYLINEEQLIVCHDDLDLPFGTLRLRKDGGSGGHHGIESIINEISTKNFKRLRIGIKKESIKKEETIDYLLNKMKIQEYKQLMPTIERASEALITTIHEGFEKAMNIFNRKAQSSI